MLKTKKIQKLREHIIKELKYARRIGVNVITINIEPELLEKAIFEEKKDEKGNVYKKFAIENSLIQELDFTGISFENFNAIGQNLEKFYGIEIDPQKLYKKSLFDTKLRNAEIKSDSEDAFKDVNLEYASLKNCKGAVLNPQTIKGKDLKHAYLEEIEVINDKDAFKDVIVADATIKNCEGAIIDPQIVFGKYLISTHLENIELKSSEEDQFKDVLTDGMSIINCKGATLNPQTIKNKNLRYVTLDNVEIKSDSEDAFKDVIITWATIKNCKGAVLNPQTIKNGSLAHTHLENIKIESYEEDQFKDIVMHHATIKNCEGAVLNPQTIYEKSLYGATIEGIGIVENKDTLNQLENVDSRNLKINAYFVGKERAIVRKR